MPDHDTPPDVALGATLLRIAVDLSHVDVGTYASFELRLAQHPSEDSNRVVARALAHCLLYEADLTAGRGLDEADDPALYVRDNTGVLLHWIDVGHPGSERLHRASKAARRVSIVCHKSRDGLVRERDKRRIHAQDRVAVWLLQPELVQALADGLTRNNDWTVVRTGEDLMVTADGETHTGRVEETTLADV